MIDMTEAFTSYPIAIFRYTVFWQWPVGDSFESAQWWVVAVSVGVADRYPVVTWHPISWVVTWDRGDYNRGIIILGDTHHNDVKGNTISRPKINHLLNSQATV